MTEENEDFSSLAGNLLIAMPSMADQRFSRSVVFLCAHTPEAAMGLVVNQLFGDTSFLQLLEQLEMEAAETMDDVKVHMGGPVEQGRGFVLHSTDVVREESLCVTEDIALTSSLEILREISAGHGPKQVLFALGYAGWGAGQLDAEIKANGWLHVAADSSIVFGADTGAKWDRALRSLGIEPSMLSVEAGRA